MNRLGSGGIVAGMYDGAPTIAGLYDLERTLGTGHFAVVKLARHVFTGEKVAVKVIDKSKLDDVSKSHLFQEVRCMKLVQHPNVVKLYEVIDTQTKLYLILELGDGGDLYDYIMRHESGLPESLARDYFRQIVRAISYCHRLHVVHRDLKPENVVFFEHLGVVKLTDFGFSNKFCPGQKLETSCGSLAYSAPEILLGDSYDAPAVDIWSLGVILYMLVCGQPPFQEANDSETLTMIMDCKYTTPPHISPECRNLIARMLVREPEKRATLQEIAMDPWVTNGEPFTIEDLNTPLVTKEQIFEDDKANIVQRMVNGGIATKEEILDALRKNEYNHITATYYLLAERKLSQRLRVGEVESGSGGGCGIGAYRRPGQLGVAAPTSGAAGAQLLQPPGAPTAPRTPQDLPPRARKCSIVREEDDEEEGGGGGSGGVGDARRPSRSDTRLAHTLHPSAQLQPPPAHLQPAPAHLQRPPAQLQPVLAHPQPAPAYLLRPPGQPQLAPGQLQPVPTHLQRSSAKLQPAPTQHPPAHHQPAHAHSQLAPAMTRVNLEDSTDTPTTCFQAQSVPSRLPFGVRLNRLGERIRPKSSIEADDTRINVPRVVPPAPPPPRRHRLDCRRRRPRAGSCSSSDLSDDDSESRKKRSTERVDVPSERRRRDSHDDSSDSQERGCGGGGGGAGFQSSGSGDATHPAPSSAPTNAGAGGGAGSGGGGSTGAGGGRRRGARKETRLRESRSLNRIAELEESAGGGVGRPLMQLCPRPLLRLLHAARLHPRAAAAPAPPAPARHTLHTLC